MNRSKLAGSMTTLVGTVAILGAGTLFAASSASEGGDDGLRTTERTAITQKIEAKLDGKVVELEREEGGVYEVKLRDADGVEHEFYVDAEGQRIAGKEDD